MKKMQYFQHTQVPCDFTKYTFTKYTFLVRKIFKITSILINYPIKIFNYFLEKHLNLFYLILI